MLTKFVDTSCLTEAEISDIEQALDAVALERVGYQSPLGRRDLLSDLAPLPTATIPTPPED
jgi:hypothetical protein